MSGASDSAAMSALKPALIARACSPDAPYDCERDPVPVRCLLEVRNEPGVRLVAWVGDEAQPRVSAARWRIRRAGRGGCEDGCESSKTEDIPSMGVLFILLLEQWDQSSFFLIF